MTIRVLYLEGASFETVELSSFSREGVLDFLELTEDEISPRDAYDASALNIEVFDNDMIVVNVFNYDGEMKSFIGRADEFVGYIDFD